jgi:hypothetical protein
LLSVSGINNSVFLNSPSVHVIPNVSAEWNHNIFNAPYLTVAGTSTQHPITKSAGKSISLITDSNKHPNFETYSFTMTGSDDYVKYSVSPSSTNKAYKMITYVTTDANSPIMVNVYAQGGTRQFGSNNGEINSYNWTKIETYIGSLDNISSFTYQISANKFSTSSTNPMVYYTKPEIYATTLFDYQYGSVWSTDTVFGAFRPGESYVPSGNADYVYPTDYRIVTTSSLLKSYTANAFHMPVSPIVASPSFFHSSSPIPVYKHGLMSDISSYKYFVSDNSNSPAVTGFYAEPILVNKVVIKLNTYLSIPTVIVTITKPDGTTISSDQIISGDDGTIVLYLNGSNLNLNKWSSSNMPSINEDGSITTSTLIKSITVTGISADARSSFNTTNNSIVSDMQKLQIVEISPRLEIDLSNYVLDLSTNKSLDSKDTYMPISSVVTDDANINFSGIPQGNVGNPIPIFSNISNLSSSKLKGLLRKNVKFYINYRLIDYIDSNNSKQQPNKLIPGGVYYSDTWQQNDIDTVSVQCYDITRYLQSMPVTDYVSNFKNAFDVITNILDLSGFTDYDIDSLYAVCNDATSPINMDYYFCNSKDTTLIDALNQIFLPYQIGAYIDNYGVMKFLSLSKIMSYAKSSSNFDLDSSVVMQGGYSITNKAKPGKLSLRYQTPKIKQSLSLQNVTNPDIRVGPSYIYTTSNDVVWQQQNIDSVGLNYLDADMSITDNSFKINQSDLLDVFHTFNLSNNGYAVIEDEIVSFVYKEYTIAKTSNPSINSTVSVKNDLELAAEINKFIKDKEIGLVENVGVISAVSHANGTVKGNTVNLVTYTITSTPTSDVANPMTTFNVGDLVSVTGMNPESLNINAQVVSKTSNSFTVVSNSTAAMASGWTAGRVTKGLDYDISITPTGNITNINRGLFGTNVSEHKVIGSPTGDIITSKDLKMATLDSSYAVGATNNNFSVSSSNKYISIKPNSTGKVLVYPNTKVDEGYNTYSVKFNFNSSTNLCSGGLFFNLNPADPSGTCFLELVRYISNNTTKYLLVFYRDFSNAASIHSYVEVTGIVNSIVNNFEKLYYKNPSPTKKDNSDAYILYADPHEAFHLRITKYPYSYTSDGEGTPTDQSGTTFTVFLNNYEINGWQKWNGTSFDPTEVNSITGLRKKITLPDWAITTPGKKFGAYMSVNPPTIPGEDITYPALSFTSKSEIGYIREIYASEKILKERSVNYYFQDREFLNGMIQGQRLFSNYKEYITQTQPVVVGINTYDVQYTNGAAVSVDVLPVEYAWFYYPGNTLTEQSYIQHQIVDEYSASYSTPINTGFRGKFAVVNNSSHMVYLKKDSDEVNQFVVNLNLWTHEVIVPSDPQIIEYVTDPGNINEVVQIDSSFIQSRESASKLLKLVGASLDNFSKDISLNIFGNPLIEVGDVVKLSYPFAGINQQKYIVHSVSNSYNNGLTTKLILNMIDRGINN